MTSSRDYPLVATGGALAIEAYLYGLSKARLLFGPMMFVDAFPGIYGLLIAGAMAAGIVLSAVMLRRWIVAADSWAILRLSLIGTYLTAMLAGALWAVADLLLIPVYSLEWPGMVVLVERPIGNAAVALMFVTIEILWVLPAAVCLTFALRAVGRARYEPGDRLVTTSES